MTLIISFVALAISIIALLINYLNYNRQRTLDNENRYFQHKLDSYRKLIEELEDSLDKSDQLMGEIESIWPIDNIEKANASNLFANKFDKIGDRIRKVYVQHAILLPQSTTDKLMEFYESFYGDNIDISSLLADKNNTTILKEIIKTDIDNKSELLEKLADFFRKDLQVEKLDAKIKSRIKRI